MRPFAFIERALAAIALIGIGLMALLYQTTGAPTPCQAAANQTAAHLPAVSREVVETCIGTKGEGGLGGLLVDMGMAVTGTSRDKLAKRLQERMDERMRSTLLDTGELRCGVLLLEGAVGKANGGPKNLAQRLGEEQKSGCRGTDK